MMVPDRMVVLLIHTPSSITTSGPIVTLGPRRQFSPIFTLGCCENKDFVLIFYSRNLTRSSPVYVVIFHLALNYCGTSLLRSPMGLGMCDLNAEVTVLQGDNVLFFALGNTILDPSRVSVMVRLYCMFIAHICSLHIMFIGLNVCTLHIVLILFIA